MKHFIVPGHRRIKSFRHVDISSRTMAHVLFCLAYSVAEVLQVPARAKPILMDGESSAVDYVTRLMISRFSAFGQMISDYFDPVTSLENYIKWVSRVSFNVPRLIGSHPDTCYLGRVEIHRMSLRYPQDREFWIYFAEVLRFQSGQSGVLVAEQDL